MESRKVSEMQSLSEITASDFIYAVQDGVPSKLTMGVMFGKTPDLRCGGSLQVDTTEEVISNGGEIPDDHVSFSLTVDNSDREFTISADSVDSSLPHFMVKRIVLKVTNGGKAIIRGGFIPTIDRVELSNVGDSVDLMSMPDGWIVTGGNRYDVYQWVPA